MARRPLLIGALVVAAGLLVALLVMRGPEPPPAAPPQPSATPTAAAATPTATGSPARVVIRTESLLPPVDDAAITADQAKAAAERYRKAARYPRTSRALEDGIDPVAASRLPPDEGEDTFEPRLLVRPSITLFEAPSEVVLYGEIVLLKRIEDRDGGKRGERRPEWQRHREPASAMRAVIQDAEGTLVANVTFRDDGTAGDAEAGDLLYTATHTPDPDEPEAFRGAFRVEALAQTADGVDLTAATSFVYSVQTAHLTGEYRDALDGGNLRIDVGVEVETAGRYQVKATLVTQQDAKMVGYAEATATLAPGTHTIPLVFYGLMFHDMKADGPYALFSTTLAALDGPSPVESDVVPNAHTTAAYSVSDFGDQPFNDPEYMQKAAHYDEVERRKRAEGR